MFTYEIDTDAKRANPRAYDLGNAMHEVFGPCWDVKPDRPSDFRMVLKSIPFGEMNLSQSSLSEAQVTNVENLSNDNSEHAYNIYLSNRRQKIVTENKTVILEPGDITVADSATAVTMITQEPYTTIGLTVPASLLHAHIPEPDKVVGVRFSGKMGLSKIVSGMLQTMWEYAESEDFNHMGTELADNLLGILSVCCNMNRLQPNEWNSDLIAKQEKIKQLINQNLHNPDLCVSELAKQFGFSIRYLQRLFSEENYTISKYIRCQRLEGCRKQLVDPAWLNHSITEIAFNWGFNSSAHFARVFKEEYGINAREFRKQNINSCLG